MMLTRSLVLSFLCAPLVAQDRAPVGSGLTPVQVMALRSVSWVGLSPDGAQVAFLRTVPRGPKDKPGAAFSHLNIVPYAGGEERTLIGGEATVREAAWSPDGRWITFLEKRGDLPHAEVWALPIDGGEAARLTKTPRGVAAYRWRPDGKAIAFTMPDAEPAARAAAKKAGVQPIVFDENNWTHLSLWLWVKDGDKLTQITEGTTAFSFEWSPTGEFLVAGLAPHNLVDDSYMFTRLHLVWPTTKKVEPLVDNPGKLGRFAVAPDGRSIAYVAAVDRNDPHAGQVFVVDREARKPRLLDKGGLGQAMVTDVEWTRAGRLGMVVARGASVVGCVASTDDDAVAFRELEPELVFTHAAIDVEHGHVAVAASCATHPAEVFVTDADHRRFLRRTTSNPWLADVPLGRQRVEKFKARDGLEIEGILIEPVGYAAGKRHPLVIVVHGGPEAHVSNGWNTNYANWGQMLAARGFFVWYPNYRASTGRGVAFAKMDHGDPMGGEFDDHLDAIARFDQLGLIDKARVGIGGGSYGGYTAAWAATKGTEHFAVAVSFVPFVDVPTTWMTSDIPSEFYFVHYQEKWPHEQFALLHDRSPLTWAHQCKTPLLILGGLADTRVHPSQPHMLYRAVKTATKTPVRYVQYPGEGHGNRTNVFQYDCALRTMAWLEHYLRPGDHRAEAPPAADVEYGDWVK